MLNRYPLWKNLLVLIVLLVCTLYALPNIYGQDPAMDVAASRGTKAAPDLADKLSKTLADAGIKPMAIESRDGRLLIRFTSGEQQLEAQDVVAKALPEGYTQALTLAPDVPAWLTALGGEPMNLGLDLRGGIHVLIDVDMDAALEQAVDRYAGDVRTTLREKKLRYLSVKADAQGVTVSFRDAATRDKANEVLGNAFRNLKLDDRDAGGEFGIRLTLLPNEVRSVKKFALEQNITTIRNRVNALGVSEPLVQQQGERRIVVELPGVQDPSRVKNLLGATATLEYRLVDTEHDLQDAVNGRVPPGSRLYKVREDGRPILLKKRVIVTGNQITDASSGFDQRSGSPMVSISLDSQGARRMRNVTTENVGKPMAVVFIETRIVGHDANGKAIKKRVEEVINVATIREPFGGRFQTTGLDSPAEAHDLALLLRAGALAAPIEIVEERTIGPSLGQDNIDQGMISVVVGLALVMVFMVLYYKVFGLVANAALLVNIVMIVAILSMLQAATLTLPGIAGIVLTVGMAVDANVLIFERIREELRVGNTPQASIHAGYERAVSTITDANITTLIAAVVLFSIGSGPVRGFAVTLAIGILTSMFTAIMGTRAIINKVYGGKPIKHLSI
jgi:preprotein translocase subunit SecD